MKKFFSAALLGSIFLLASCGDDSGEISGTYEIISISSSQCDDTDLNFSYNLENDNCIMESGFEICVDGTFTLASNGSFTGSFTVMALGFSETDTFTGTYTVDGNNITICDDTGDCETGTVNSSGDRITLRFPEDEDGCIVTITGKK